MIRLFEVECKFAWWAKPLIFILSSLVSIGLIEPTVERVEGFADWMAKHGGITLLFNPVVEGGE